MTSDPKKTCFLISPIGEAGSDVRTAADDLFDLIIVPALDVFQFGVVRADKIPSASVITNDIIQYVQQSELCVIDLTGSNANVFYECGRRHETGKPFIQLIRKGEKLPFDVAGIRTIEYDLSTPRSVHEVVTTIQSFVKELDAQGFDAASSGASLTTIANTLQRIERKLDEPSISAERPWAPQHEELSAVDKIRVQLDPAAGMELALKTGDVHLARTSLDIMAKDGKYSEVLLTFAMPLAAMGEDRVAKQIVYEHFSEEGTDLFGQFDDDEEILARLSSVYEVCTRFEDAQEATKSVIPKLTSFIDDNPNASDEVRFQFLDTIALLYNLIDEWDSALLYAERALETRPASLKVLNDELYYYDKLDRLSQRVEVAKKMVEITGGDFDDEGFFDSTIEVFEKTGDNETVGMLKDKYKEKFP